MRQEKTGNYKSDLFISSPSGFQMIEISSSLAFLLGMCSLGDFLFKDGLIKVVFSKVEKKFSVNLLRHLTHLSLKCNGFYDYDICIGSLHFEESELEKIVSNDMNFAIKNISSSNNSHWPINLNQLKSGTFHFENLLNKPVKSKFAEIIIDFLPK